MPVLEYRLRANDFDNASGRKVNDGASVKGTPKTSNNLGGPRDGPLLALSV